MTSRRDASGSSHGQSHTAWMFTVFNDLDGVDPTKWASFRYAAYQREQCPATGREHIQGYVMFTKRVSLSACKKLDQTAHWEPRRGSHDQAVDYCTKEDTRRSGAEPVTVGDPPKPGKRSDLHDLADSINAGASLKELARSHTHTMLKCGKNALMVRSLLMVPRNTKPKVHVYFGGTGLGKSHKAHEFEDAYWVPNETKDHSLWFDRYDGEKVCVFDDFYGGVCPWRFLLRLLDRYPNSVPYKGGYVEFVSDVVVFTSNSPPWSWYKNNEHQHWDALERRIDVCLKFTSMGVHDVLKDEGVNVLYDIWKDYVVDVVDRGSNGRSVNWVDPVVDRNPQTGN